MASNLDNIIEKLWNCELIPENDVRMLCNKCREIVMEEGNVQRVDLPVTVCFLSLNVFIHCSFHCLLLFHRSAAISTDSSMT